MRWICRLFGPRPQYRIEVCPNKRHGWFWRVRHQNGQVLCTSEEYSSRGAAWDTADNLATSVGWPCIEAVS